eukprot:gnl/MRDRNA2_/MRDRNA2_27398_c0_seq1.p1 gnl/MRDRNA2_/MRDRNA2_27398_c0~~gnl/MRDRNA2_/MRDRNA2_27398_c0_seq1.p1  ORF type:complete len:513 (-),score=87.69 gnl/MRDRNA2_/MRDRNA2_27398_c0_seq1:10-1338(-)
MVAFTDSQAAINRGTWHTEAEQAGCLLQNKVVTGGQVSLTDMETTQGPYVGDLSLSVYESKLKDEINALYQSLQLSQERLTKYSAHSVELRRATRALSLLSRSTVLVDFVDTPEDGCHSQLLDARHQLNQLHVHVVELTHKVNASEEQIMMYDKVLQGALQERVELINWKQDEIEKCSAEKLKAIRMFAKLSTELQEMQQIASPSMAMLIKDASMRDMFSVQQASLHVTASINAAGEEKSSPLPQRHVLQNEFPGHFMPTPSHSIRKARRVTLHELKKVSALVADTHHSSLALRKCMKLQATLVQGVLEKPTKPEEECQAETDALQNTYLKAHVELSRLKAEYEQLANSTACVDTTLDLYMNRRAPMQKEADGLTTGINSNVAELQSLRPLVDGARTWDSKLQNRLDQLNNECDNVSPTVSDLNNLRDAIQAISSCPGLSRA